MAVTIDPSVGGASSNSFVTLAEAQAYMDGRLNESAWESATADSQNRALVEATRDISVLTWKGTRASSTQALSWPRWFVLNPDLPWAGVTYYASTVIPDRVKNATCELALQYIKAGTTDVAAQDPLQNITEKTIGPLTTRYSEPLNRARGIARYPRALAYVAPLLESAGLTVPVVRG